MPAPARRRRFATAQPSMRRLAPSPAPSAPAVLSPEYVRRAPTDADPAYVTCVVPSARFDVASSLLSDHCRRGRRRSGILARQPSGEPVAVVATRRQRRRIRSEVDARAEPRSLAYGDPGSRRTGTPGRYLLLLSAFATAAAPERGTRRGVFRIVRWRRFGSARTTTTRRTRSQRRHATGLQRVARARYTSALRSRASARARYTAHPPHVREAQRVQSIARRKNPRIPIVLNTATDTARPSTQIHGRM